MNYNSKQTPPAIGSSSVAVTTGPISSQGGAALAQAESGEKPAAIAASTTHNTDQGGQVPFAKHAPLPRATAMAYQGKLMRKPDSASKLTPKVLQNKKLRSGKWIPQEEQYAELLIQAFEKGQITDCENGCTLRFYLSQKLHCAPMRISKKFAGKGIGKMVYLSKVNVVLRQNPEGFKNILKQLNESEQKFLQAALPTNNFLQMSSFGEVRGHAAVPMIPGVGLVPLIQPPHFAFPTPQQFASNALGQNAPFAATGPVQNKIIAEEQAKQLQQTYLNALNQLQRNPSVISNQAAGAQTFISPTSSSATSATASNQIPTAVQSGLPSATSHKVPVESSHTSSVTAPATTQQPPVLNNINTLKQIAAVMNGQTSAPSQSTTMHHGPLQPLQANSVVATVPQQLSQPEIPSQKLAVQLAQSSDGKIPQSQPLACDPAKGMKTSRSFDDFHAFWGKEQANQNALNPSSTGDANVMPEAQSSNNITTPDIMALFNADSYAMFAQDSAMAASQHAAYMPQGASVPTKDQMSDSTLDVGGMLKLVSQHVNEQNQTTVAGTASAESSNATDRLKPTLPPAQVSLSQFQLPATQQTNTSTLLPKVVTKSITERLYGSPNPNLGTSSQFTLPYTIQSRSPNLISGSEPSVSATETESSVNCRGSSDSMGSDSNSNSGGSSSSDNVSSHDSEGNSSDGEGPQRKKTKAIANLRGQGLQGAAYI